MDKPDTAHTIHQLAAKMRRQAQETALPDYQRLMLRAANSLDAEAELIADEHLTEFARALELFAASQFTSARVH